MSDEDDGPAAEENYETGDSHTVEDERLLSRRRGIALGVALVVLVLVGAIWVLGSPPTPDEEPVSPSERNTELFYTLAEASITDAVVDITNERALVRYNVPENMTRNESIYYTLGATARVTNETERVVLEVFRDNQPVERVEVRTEAVVSYLSDETSLPELEDEIERTGM